MKTFSRLSLLTLMFFSVAFLLIGNVPHANAQVRAGMDIQVDPAKVVYNPETDGDVLVTFELTADGTPLPPDREIVITWITTSRIVPNPVRSYVTIYECDQRGSKVRVLPDYDDTAPELSPVISPDGKPVERGEGVIVKTDSSGKIYLCVSVDPKICADYPWATEYDRIGDQVPEYADFQVTVSGTYWGPGLPTHPPDTWLYVQNTAWLDYTCEYKYPCVLKVLKPEPCVHGDHEHVTFDPKKNVKVGDVFSQQICIQNVTDLASWQMNVVFNPSILEVVSIEEGDFLEKPIEVSSSHDPHYVPSPNDLNVVTYIPVDALFFSSVGAGWIPVRDWKVGEDNFELQEVDPSPAHGLAHPDSDIADYLKRGTKEKLFTTKVAEGKIAAMQARVAPRAHITLDNLDATVEAPHKPLNGVSGTGILMTICFRVLEFAEEPLGIHNVQLTDSIGDRISYSIQVNDFIVVTDKFPKEDVNRDGYVNIQDLVLVASNIGLVPGNLHNPMADANGDGGYTPNGGYALGGRTTGAMHTEFQPPNNSVESNLTSLGDSHSRVDVNDDGIVNILDLIQVALSPNWGGESTITKVRNANIAALPAAPSMVAENLTPATIQAWIGLAQVEHDGSAIFDVGIMNLESLLAARIPSETKLLLNYPNPFNPETWIPYQLAEATEVTMTIYSVNGAVIRTLELGHRAAGTYQSKSQAAYWDGRNEFGEQVASGLYFYTLTAGDFRATGKMLVRK